MAGNDVRELTTLLKRGGQRERPALEELAPRGGRELHRIAARQLARERLNHTLQTTALINEAYVRLIDWKGVEWQNRAHLFGVCGEFMRRSLVDKARANRGAKRGGGAV